jgi:hypothetical protein
VTQEKQFGRIKHRHAGQYLYHDNADGSCSAAHMILNIVCCNNYILSLSLATEPTDRITGLPYLFGREILQRSANELIPYFN